MILREARQVIMAAAIDADKSDAARVELLQLLAVADRYEEVAGSVDDINGAFYFLDPLVRAQVVAQHKTHGQYRQEAFHHLAEVVVGRIQDKVAGTVVRGHLYGKAASEAASVHDKMVFGILGGQGFVNELHIVQHFLFTPLPGAFTKAAVVHQHHVVIVAVKIAGIFCPALDASRVAVEIEDQSFRLRAVKVQAVDAYAWLHVKVHFAERGIVAELEFLRQLFRLENEVILQEINSKGKQGDASDDIVDNAGHWSGR